SSAKVRQYFADADADADAKKSAEPADSDADAERSAHHYLKAYLADTHRYDPAVIAQFLQFELKIALVLPHFPVLYYLLNIIVHIIILWRYNL
ncbi:unnamed protein product, partial [Rotaria socialis]